MLGSGEIIERSEAIPTGSYVYFLIDNLEIVYVGQSVNLHARIATHLQSKDFDRVSWIDCGNKDLNEIEADYIIKFNPKYNIEFPVCDKYTRSTGIKDMELRRKIKQKLTPIRSAIIQSSKGSSSQYHIYHTNDFLSAKAEVLREDLFDLELLIDQLKRRGE